MANISDIAKRANVSTATVSHVINETRFVREETRTRVIKAMKELNYQPNFAARSLRRKMTKIIGILLPDVTNLFYMDIVEGIDSVLAKRGYNLIVSNSSNDIDIEKKQFAVFNTQLIDGLIIRPTYGDHSFLHNYSDSFPMVFLDCKPNNYQAENCILTDNIIGAYEATELLLKKGHKRIGLINGLLGETTSDERLVGYKKALADNGINIDIDIIRNGDYKLQSGYKLTKELLEKTDITALFITNNVMTMGALRCIKEMKINVPDELAIIGFDDQEWAKLITPSLTVVKQYPYKIGIKAAKVLLSKIKDKDNNLKEHRFPAKLVVRESC